MDAECYIFRTLPHGVSSQTEAEDFIRDALMEAGFGTVRLTVVDEKHMIWTGEGQPVGIWGEGWRQMPLEMPAFRPLLTYAQAGA